MCKLYYLFKISNLDNIKVLFVIVIVIIRNWVRIRFVYVEFFVLMIEVFFLKFLSRFWKFFFFLWMIFVIVIGIGFEGNKSMILVFVVDLFWWSDFKNRWSFLLVVFLDKWVMISFCIVCVFVFSRVFIFCSVVWDLLVFLFLLLIGVNLLFCKKFYLECILEKLVFYFLKKEKYEEYGRVCKFYVFFCKSWLRK